MIDPSARVDPSAKLAEDVKVGPWTIIGPGVTVESGSVIESHVVIRANTRIGRNNRIFQHSSIGEDPSDKKYAGEETWLEIGDNNIFREGCNIHRGSAGGGAVTRSGDGNLLMPYVHVAHDCMVGNNVVMANNVGISGHVQVADWVILGGYAGVNQFIKIGAHAMVGGMTHVTNDVPAYIILSGNPATVRSINAIGLERRGFSKQSIAAIRKAYKIIYMRGYSLQEAIVELKAMSGSHNELAVLVESLEASEKGIHR